MPDVKNHIRVVDMMLTSHSVLRDRNSRKALIVDIIILGASIILVAMVFADNRILEPLGIKLDVSEYLVGIASLLVFFFSLLSFRVDWKKKESEHHHASISLSNLKLKLSSHNKCGETLNKEHEKALINEYNIIMGSIHPIPDKIFNKLKAIHLRKIEISKALSRNPGSSNFFLKLKIWLSTTYVALREKRHRADC